MAAITLEELLKEVGVHPEKLNEAASDDHLLEIALFLTSWRTVASHLDLGENDLDDAEQGGRKVKDKSLKTLQIWKGKFGFKATYRKLVDVLLSLAMADVAEKVCHLLQGTVYLFYSHPCGSLYIYPCALKVFSNLTSGIARTSPMLGHGLGTLHLRKILKLRCIRGGLGHACSPRTFLEFYSLPHRF